MDIHSKILSGVAAIALFAAVPALAQSGDTSTSTAPGASTPAQTDNAAMTSTAKPMHKKAHHHVSKKSASTDTSAEDATTAQLNQQQISNPGSTAPAPDASAPH